MFWGWDSESILSVKIMQIHSSSFFSLLYFGIFFLNLCPFKSQHINSILNPMNKTSSLTFPACKLSSRGGKQTMAVPSAHYYNSYRHNSVSSPTISECSEASGTGVRRDDYIFHQPPQTEYATPSTAIQHPVGYHPDYSSQNEAMSSYSDYYSYTDYNYYDNNPDTCYTQTGKSSIRGSNK